MTPRATYRLQLNSEFTLSDAAVVLPYLARLGISHVYCSPVLTARPGSTHCYDIVDHGTINPELGGMAAFERFVAVLRREGLGLLLDIVPNHMGIAGADNRLWLDVLEWGRASPYASWFDVDWDAGETPRGQVLLPFLGEPYGVALEEGKIQLRFDAAAGRLSACYHQHCFPISPRDYATVLDGVPLRAEADAAEAVVRSRAHGSAGVRAAFDGLRRRIASLAADAEVRHRIETAVARFDAAAPEGRGRLHALLDRQNYRLAWWRAAADEVNYRRFFNINELAGFRVEVPAAFDASHALILDLWHRGLIDGVRIDHVDGLAEPRAYCRKLRRTMEAAAEGRPEGLSRQPWIVVEKIFARHETLPPGWQADGTTGYDFMNAVGAVLHDPAGEAALTRLQDELSGRPSNFHDEEIAARRQMLRDYFTAELAGVARAVHRILRADPRTRDFTLTGVRRAVAEIVAHFPSYRTYVTRSGPSAEDLATLEWALAGARRALRPVERPLLDELAAVLSGRGIRTTPPGTRRRDAQLAVRRFQQLTAPVAAKAVEDTAFYRYVRLLSRNEVGADPGRFALPPAGFRRFQQRLRRTPLTLLSTATHDHKRGEDARARLAVLSEYADEWVITVHRWMRLNAPLKTEVHGVPAPSAIDEHQLYQTLVGAWPPGLGPDDVGAIQRFAARVEAALLKAVREAKLQTDWGIGDETYEEAAIRFLQACLDPQRTAPFAREVAVFVESIGQAGLLKGLAQTMLKCWSVGVPDFYQGTEWWDFSLVDPDNRAPVDFAARAAALDGADRGDTYANGWRDGTIKQRIIHRLLAFRAENEKLFVSGSYLVAKISGELADDLLVQMVANDDRAALLIVPRLTRRLVPRLSGRLDLAAFQRTTLTLPSGFGNCRARLALDRSTIPLTRHMPLASLLSLELPLVSVALTID